MKYEAKNDGSGKAVSTAASLPWVSISQTSAITTASAACTGCHLISEAEWMTIAQNVLSVSSNWSTGTVGSGYIYSGHNDNAPANALVADTNDSNGYYGETNTGGNQRRTLTLANGQVIWDLAGNVLEWTDATMSGGQQPGFAGESTYSWKQWNNGALIWNGLGSASRPSSSLPSAAGWSSTQGIGQVLSNLGATDTRSFFRGGMWADGSDAGCVALNLNASPGSSITYVGFRVSR